MSSSSWAAAAALPPPPPPDSSSLGWSGFLPRGDDFGQDYVGFRFSKNPQPPQEAGTILAEDSSSSSSGGTGSTTEGSSGWTNNASGVAGEVPAQKGNRKALRKSGAVFFFSFFLEVCPPARLQSLFCPLLLLPPPPPKSLKRVYISEHMNNC